MIRQIIKINQDKCDGCGLCVSACHEGAIGLIDGKAKLLRDDYCDGFGDCLPSCLTGAITFEKREALDYNEYEVQKNILQKNIPEQNEVLPCGCPGTNAKPINRNIEIAEKTSVSMTHLNQWPVQIKLVPINAPYFDNANLLIAADCCAYAYGNFHQEYMRNKITLIGCPKLDDVDYSEKLTAILTNNNIKSVTVVRMEVPCCGGIENAIKRALQNSGKIIPWQIVTISTNGRILE